MAPLLSVAVGMAPLLSVAVGCCRHGPVAVGCCRLLSVADGMTPLHEAAYAGFADMCKLLLECMLAYADVC